MKWLRRIFRRTASRSDLIYRADLDFAAEQAAIDAAQAEVDARAHAQVNEAHAQAALDKANAAARFHFEIHGTGTLTAKQLLSAVGWDLNTDIRQPHKPPSGWRFPAPNPDPDYSSFLRWLGRGLTRADLKRLRLWR